MTHKLSFKLATDFSAELDTLRQTFANDEWPGGTSKDDFDDDSYHLLALIDSEVAGMVRLTFHPRSPLTQWAISSHSVPDNLRAIEATRAVVAPKWRGNGIYKWLMVNLVIWAACNGVEEIIGGVELDFPAMPFLDSLGFIKLGTPSSFTNPPKGECLGQVISLNVPESADKAEALLNDYSHKWLKQGHQLDTNIQDSDGTVISQVHGRCMKLTLNRPQKLNAISFQVLCDLYRCLIKASCDDRIDSVLLKGQGRCFSAGADLDNLADENRTKALDFVRFGAQICHLIAGFNKPIVAGLHGYAMAGGLELAVSCSLRIATADCKLAFPETRLGIIPGWNGVERASQICGAQRAQFLADTARVIDGSTAKSWGMVDLVLPSKTFESQLVEICNDLTSTQAVPNHVLSFDPERASLRPNPEGVTKGFEQLFMQPETLAKIRDYKATIGGRTGDSN